MTTRSLQPVAAALALMAVGLWTIGGGAWSCLLACTLAQDACCGPRDTVGAGCSASCDVACNANASPVSCCDADDRPVCQATCEPQPESGCNGQLTASLACDCPCLALGLSCNERNCTYQPRPAPLTDERRDSLDRLAERDQLPHPEPPWAPQWGHAASTPPRSSPGASTLARAAPRAVLCIWLN